MGMLPRILVVTALPVLLISLICVPDPKALLGEALGRKLQIGRSRASIIFFSKYVSPADAHPQLAALEHVVNGLKADREAGRTHASLLDRTIDLVDDYGWNHSFLINVGDVKGKILDAAVRQRLQDGPGEPKLVVELGTFLGYGTLRLVRMLNQSKAEIMTVDPDIFAYSLSSSLYEQAQVRDRITMKTDFSYNVFKELKKQGRQIDLLFVDHVKKFYLPDLKLALELGILAKGCVVVGDNIVFPGAPDYLEYLLNGDGQKLFATQVLSFLLSRVGSLGMLWKGGATQNEV